MRLPKGQFGAIMADPPLKFDTWSHKGEGRTPQHHYRCPAFDKLAAIPVASAAAPDCFLFLWVPLRSVFVVEPLMNARGFVFSGSAFTWAKQNLNGVGWFVRWRLRYYGPYMQTPLEARFGRHRGLRQGIRVRRELEALVAYGLATRRHIRVGGGSWSASMITP